MSLSRPLPAQLKSPKGRVEVIAKARLKMAGFLFSGLKMTNQPAFYCFGSGAELA
jgi:hypothetical protein